MFVRYDFPTAGRQCPIPCQRSHLPPSAFPKLEGESGARPGGCCQGLSLITIRVHLINIPRGHGPCLASPPGILLWRGSGSGEGEGATGVHSGSSDHARAWPAPALSSLKPFLCPAPRAQGRPLYFQFIQIHSTKPHHPGPGGLLALSPRPPWEDTSRPFSEPVGTERSRSQPPVL